MKQKNEFQKEQENKASQIFLKNKHFLATDAYPLARLITDVMWVQAYSEPC